MDPDSNWQFTYDVRRTLILGRYMQHWGMPENRIVSQKARNRIEVYSFPPNHHIPIYRFATVGASSCLKESGALGGNEFLLTLPASLAGASATQAMNFVLDVAVHGLTAGVTFTIGATIERVSVMPSCWRTQSLLLDEPRGEPEELSSFHIGDEHIDLLWIVPIYTNEFRLIQSTGIDEFCRLERALLAELIDPNRASLVNHNAGPSS